MIFCVLRWTWSFVFIFVCVFVCIYVLRFCAATDFSVNKDLYNRPHPWYACDYDATEKSTVSEVPCAPKSTAEVAAVVSVRDTSRQAVKRIACCSDN